MFTLLTLMVTCWAVSGVSSAATPLRFRVHNDDLTMLDDISSVSAPELHFETSILFPGRVAGDTESADPRDEITSSVKTPTDKFILPDVLNRDSTLVNVTDCIYDNLTMWYNGIKWKILSRGHCAEEEWAVIVAECQPECRPRPCSVGLLEYQGNCVDPANTSVCDGDQILYVTQRGSSYCDCKENYFYYPWSGQCYARRERGRCDFGYFLEITQNGDVDCIPNECRIDGFEKDPDSGKCFLKEFVGYCPPNSLQFHHNNLTVGCLLIHSRNIIDRPITPSCPPGSRISYLGTCREEFVMPSITLSPRSLTGSCESGYIKVGDGPCQRLNSYI